MSKKQFIVEIPLNAKITVVIEAESEDDAIQEALAKCDLQLNPTSEIGYNIEEWDVYDKMLQGSFWSGIIYQASAEVDEWA